MNTKKFIFFLTLFLLAFGSLLIIIISLDTRSNPKQLKGEVVFDLEWTAKPKREGETNMYVWSIPVKVASDTIFIDYYEIEGGVRDLVTTKFLHDLGYSIEDRFKIVHLFDDEKPYIKYIDNQ